MNSYPDWCIVKQNPWYTSMQRTGFKLLFAKLGMSSSLLTVPGANDGRTLFGFPILSETGYLDQSSIQNRTREHLQSLCDLSSWVLSIDALNWEALFFERDSSLTASGGHTVSLQIQECVNGLSQYRLDIFPRFSPGAPLDELLTNSTDSIREIGLMIKMFELDKIRKLVKGEEYE